MGPDGYNAGITTFHFAASALQSGDTVMIMLFHDSVSVAVEGANKNMMPVGSPLPRERISGRLQGRYFLKTG